MNDLDTARPPRPGPTLLLDLTARSIPLSKPKYWLLQVPPQTVFEQLTRQGLAFRRLFLGEGLGELDPNTRVVRSWYDPERNLFCMVLEGENGYLTPEGGLVPELRPSVKTVDLDYGDLAHLEEILKDPDCGEGIAEWARGLAEDLAGIGFRPSV